MKVLLDNTLIHRVGAVLDAAPGNPVAPVDLLATFHLAEHILFAEQLMVSTFERPETAERTAYIIDLLERRGLGGEEGARRFIAAVPFTSDEYESACDKAGAAIQDDLEDLSAADLRTWGAFADEAARPTSLPAFPFHELASQPFRRIEERRDTAQLLDLRAAGAFELTLLKNEALHARLSALNAEAALFDSRQSAALTVIFRLKINQELARLQSALYAPAPQRARVSHCADQLFRYRLETMIEKSVAEGINTDRRGVVKHLRSLQALPLPVFALHFLRQSDIRSPHSLLEAAWDLRNKKEVKEVRDWLTEWERKLSSEPKERISALRAIDSWASDLRALLAAEDQSVIASVIASVNPGMTFDPTTGIPILSAEIGDLEEPLARLWRRLSRQRRFLAVISTELATDNELGAFILRSVNRSLRRP